MLLLLVMALTGCGLANKAAEKAAETVAEKAVETATGVSVDQKNNAVTIKGQVLGWHPSLRAHRVGERFGGGELGGGDRTRSEQRCIRG